MRRLLTPDRTSDKQRLRSLIRRTVVALAAAGTAASVHAATTSPVCPSGFTFSRPEGVCIASATPTCTKPNKWNSALKGCYTTVTATCPSGYGFEKGGSMCRPSNMTTASSTASPTTAISLKPETTASGSGPALQHPKPERTNPPLDPLPATRDTTSTRVTSR